MRCEDSLWKAASVAQPGNHLARINGVRVIDYSTALSWALVVGDLGGAMQPLGFWKTRPVPAEVDRCLSTIVGALPAGTFKSELTQHVWLQELERGRAMLDASLGPAIVLDTSFELEDTPPVPPALGGGATDAEKAARKEQMQRCWGTDTKWARLVVWGELKDLTSERCPVGGRLAYACAGVGQADAQGRAGPWGKIALRIMQDHRPCGSDTVGYGMDEDVAEAVVQLLHRGLSGAPLEFGIYTPAGARRRQAFLDELKCGDPEHRMRWQAALYDARSTRIVPTWEPILLVVKGELAPARVSEMTCELIRAMGLEGGATLPNVKALADALQQHVPLLRQPDVASTPPEKRARTVAALLQTKKRMDERTAGAVTTAGTDSSGGGVAAGQAVAKGRKDLIFRAAGGGRFLEIMADARSLYADGRISEAHQVLFTGKSSAHPEGQHDLLAIKCAWGMVDAADLDGEMRYAWLADVVAHGGEYLAHMVTKHVIRDGDVDAEDVRALRLDALWEALRSPGSKWGHKINMYDMILRPIYEAIHGGGGAAAAAE